MEKLAKYNKPFITKDKGVYMIWFDNKPDQYYIGSSKNLKKRCGEHYNRLLNNNHHNKKLQNHVNKYGILDFNFCIHYVNNNITEQELRKIEAIEIKTYNSFYNGFNLTENTIHPGCVKMSKESRLKISIAATKRQSSQEYKDKLSLKYSGTNSITSKLTIENIKYIKEKAIIKGVKCMNIRILAKELNVSTITIQRLLKGKTYKNN